MSFRRWLLLMSTLGLLVCLVAAPVLASEEGGANPVFSTTGLVFRILNFLIIAYGAWYLFAKKLPGAFHARAEGIAASISDAARAKQEAERLLREAEEKTAQLGQEVAAMRATAQRDAAAEAERIRAATREEAAKIERAAEMEIQAAERAARMELKALGAQLAVERAEGALRGKMTPATEAALFRAFVGDLGRSAN
ncbi:MAG: ATP synthase F0 subunit B [Acidobacteria bacterium]|nr:ATP synthase F0 subunit B [Acidobacteriota bacterium]MCL5287724.1 ATP synthase F0 subunit B [Acidobacteriota bacterium]